jgi:hypothetical protein
MQNRRGANRASGGNFLGSGRVTGIPGRTRERRDWVQIADKPPGTRLSDPKDGFMPLRRFSRQKKLLKSPLLREVVADQFDLLEPQSMPA